MIRVRFARCQQTVVGDSKYRNLIFALVWRISTTVVNWLRTCSAKFPVPPVSERITTTFLCARAASRTDFLSVIRAENLDCAAHLIEARPNTFAHTFGKGIVDDRSAHSGHTGTGRRPSRIRTRCVGI